MDLFEGFSYKAGFINLNIDLLEKYSLCSDEKEIKLAESEFVKKYKKLQK